jgi:hypothetical protein
MNSNTITDNGKVRCPRCEKVQDVLAYTPLENLANDTVPIIKCNLCRFVFAPFEIYVRSQTKT